ncbi:MAG TPA: ABC transporter permease [Bryobacteraceae bacterium]|nr:ABC transporter permease [Bryobacteraceae bacterium]
MNDLRFAGRMLRKDWGFYGVAIATLALGIGANTAIFSVVDGVILRPLAYRESQRLVVIHEMVPKFANLAPLIPVNAMHFLEWRKTSSSFSEMALLGGMTFNLTGSGEPERIPAARVSPSLFPMLGVQARLGRTFLNEEDQAGRDRVVVLNEELWKRRFAADPNVIGRKILLNGNPYEVVGVLPASFHFPKLNQLFAMTVAEEKPQLWKPFGLRDDEKDDMGDFNFSCIARLGPGVSVSQALSELNVIQSNIAGRISEKVELRAAVVPLQEQITGRARTGLQLMLAAVGAVLLICCVNIANLLLARATTRRREMAIRSAIGASSARLARQMLVESLLLSGLGGLAGVLIAYAAIRVILASAPVDLPRLDEIHLDPRVLLFTLGISIVAGLLFGFLPAWRFAQADPQDAMRSGARGTTVGKGSGRLRSLLVTLEVGLSAMCLVAGGWLLHSFFKLLDVDRGFETQRVVTVGLNLPSTRYPDREKRAAFLQSMLEHVQALPGVTSAGVSNILPLGGEGGNNLVAPEGSKVPLMERALADIRQVSPEYFRTLGIPLRAGRFFGEGDRSRSVALISPLTADRLWPGQNPLGKRFRMGGDQSPPIDVVGIAGDVRGVSLNKNPSATVYVPYWQRNFGQASLAVKTAMEPLAASSAIRAAIRAVDPELPVPAFRTMDEIVSESVAQRRFQMTLVLLFGLTALLLASLGIYGVVSYSVAQRTNEMGIRMALGAPLAGIRSLVLRQSLPPVVLGLGIGVFASLALSRVLSSLLFGIGAGDPLTILGVIALLSSVAIGAAYIPARRATQVDPITALRYE